MRATPEPDTWKRALDQIRDARLDLGRKKDQLSQEQRQITEARNWKERELAQFRGEIGPKTERRARVVVDCRDETTAKVRLTYTVGGATWHPEYRLDFTADRGEKIGPGAAELWVSAVVQQSTGEDWKDVEIALSTQKPRLGADAPIPAPLWVDASKVDSGKVLVDAQQHYASIQPGSAAGRKEPGPASAALEDRGQSFTLELPRKISVIADGRPYWMPVDSISLRAEAKLVAIPKLRSYVYQMLELKNPAPYPLLEGRVDVLRKGSFIGRTVVPYRAPGEPIEVSLGIDEELKVERKPLTDVDRRAGLLSSTKHLERAFRISVTNRARARLPVEIREGIPVSKIDKVSVEIDREHTTRGFDFDRDCGKMVWRLDLGSGEEKMVDLGYSIHLPDSWEVRVSAR
jgi:uncharacterized protein (TIGR02231 family)